MLQGERVTDLAVSRDGSKVRPAARGAGFCSRGGRFARLLRLLLLRLLLRPGRVISRRVPRPRGLLSRPVSPDVHNLPGSADPHVLAPENGGGRVRDRVREHDVPRCRVRRAARPGHRLERDAPGGPCPRVPVRSFEVLENGLHCTSPPYSLSLTHSCSQVHLWDMEEALIVQRYRGHKAVRGPRPGAGGTLRGETRPAVHAHGHENTHFRVTHSLLFMLRVIEPRRRPPWAPRADGTGGAARAGALRSAVGVRRSARGPCGLRERVLAGASRADAAFPFFARAGVRTRSTGRLRTRGGA